MTVLPVKSFSASAIAVKVTSDGLTYKAGWLSVNEVPSMIWPTVVPGARVGSPMIRIPETKPAVLVQVTRYRLASATDVAAVPTWQPVRIRLSPVAVSVTVDGLT